MASTGSDAETGKRLRDWDHVLQSIGKILSTRKGERVMLHEFGSAVPDILADPLNEETLLSLYLAIDEALTRWEPRFRLKRVVVAEAGTHGRCTLDLVGTYYPRGHRGDFAEAIDDIARVET